MAFLSRLKQEKNKFRLLSHQIKRHYFSHYHNNSLANSRTTCSRSLIPLPYHPNLDTDKFLRNVRFYAAPVQPKKEEKEVGYRLNEQIKAQTVRLIEGKEHCVISRYEALKRAKEAGMDLVEVDASGKPPACKIYDYKMDLVLRKKREKENKQQKRIKGLKTGTSKEVRFAGKISKHDLQMKADTVKRLLEKGHRIKCTAIDPTEDMDLKTLLSRFSALIEDVALPENEPQVEKKQAFVIVRHVKFGGPKRGRKKASKGESEGEQLKEEGGDAVGTESETKDTSDSEELLDEDVETKESEWVVSGEKDNSDTVFAAVDRINERAKNTEHVVEFEQANTGPSSAPKQGMVNRYAKVQPNVNDRSTLNRPNTVPQMPRTPQFSMNPPPQHPYPRNQPHLNPDTSSQMRQTPRAEVPAPPLPYQRNQPQSNTNASSPNMRQMPCDGAPGFGVQRQDPPTGNLGSPTKTFGIFSPKPKDTQSSGQSAPAVTNRYQKANPPGPERSPGTSGPRINRGPGFNSTEQRRQGGFSADDSNAYPNRNGEQADYRRR